MSILQLGIRISIKSYRTMGGFSYEACLRIALRQPEIAFSALDLHDYFVLIREIVEHFEGFSMKDVEGVRENPVR
ncbi:hypothetical protein [Pandoraea anhela]|uniref:hypothetical protein n=1 Tax=Pandoraea anhela TaxID=2508295 RepID=UPI00123FA3BC|nr:hypothetical protein [Pandoraea anhela]